MKHVSRSNAVSTKIFDVLMGGKSEKIFVLRFDAELMLNLLLNPTFTRGRHS